MPWMFVAILIAFWLWGVNTGYLMGGFIHVILILAVLLAIIHVIQGQKPSS